ncbi:kynurenine formamidase isoform X3 [Pezoporus flaviventris]|uniref:kynurenine formamidase isoform X3 n=1 Tax=Pezoporus flaviventris TaxID=889875 RepID=UPI002AB1B93A|nr:kynurenine formamidase isoform X3 [Pezoporus flaviventris]
MGGWWDMAAEELEQQYSPSRWSPRLGPDEVIQAHLAAAAAGTQRARAGAQTSLHVPYGDGDGEKLDMYLPTDPSGTFPVLVYIHGGYWQCLSKDESGFAAPSLVSQGVGLVAVGYDIAPKGAVLVSGVYDLEPILHTYVNDALHMSREVAQRNSPLLHIAPAAPAAAACKVLVAMAQHDSPEFRRQSREYVLALRAAGWSVSMLDLAGVDHFDIVEKLSEDSYILTQVILNMTLSA